MPSVDAAFHAGARAQRAPSVHATHPEIATGKACAATVYNHAVMRTAASFRLMLQLALAAALLLAITPTISRVLAASDFAHQPILMELCTSAGMEQIDISSFIGAEEPATAAHGATDAACGYCLLATPLPLLLLALVVMLFPKAGRLRVQRAAPCLCVSRNRRGLGSQGPPFAL